MKNLVLFRKNLRIFDNPALFNACENGTILPVYLHDDNSLNRSLGAASKYWLYYALNSLNNDLTAINLNGRNRRTDQTSVSLNFLLAFWCTWWLPDVSWWLSGAHW